MISTAPAIIKRNRTDRIGTMLKQQKSNPFIIKRQEAVGGFGGNVPAPTPIPDVGQFGTPGSLPMNPGPVEPDILTSGGPSTSPPAPDYWTRIDPNMGFIQPTLNIDPSQGQVQSPAQFPTVGPQGPFPGGNMGGPQGSLYGINPVTGNPIYNVTGSPRPGFFDSTLGKFTRGVGAGALNAFVPGAGFVAGKIFDAARRANERRNTGTDLSSRYRPSGGTATGPSRPSGSSNPAWFQRGYQPPQGIQDAMARGDYSRAFGPTPLSAASNKLMAMQAMHGNPNNTRAFASEGRFLIDDEGTPSMQGPMYGNRQGEFQMPQASGPGGGAGNTAAINAWLMKQPAYLKFMQSKGG